MLYQRVGGLHGDRTMVYELEGIEDTDPVMYLNIYDDDTDNFVCCFVLREVRTFEDRPCYIYTYAGKCDTLMQRRDLQRKEGQHAADIQFSCN